MWMCVVLAVAIVLSSTSVAGAVATRPGFNTTTYGANDDGSFPCVSTEDGTPSGCTPTAVPIGFAVNFFGNTETSAYVNNNGNITFDAPLDEFTPFGLTTNIGTSIIAAFFADVDTRAGNTVTFGPGTVDSHVAFGVNWPGVGYYDTHNDKLNRFQLLLIERSDTGVGNFDIEFNYDQIQWETGDASGGENGFGGDSARVGYSNGTGNPGTFFELAGSGVNGAFLDSNMSTGLIHNSLNSTVLGRYIFFVRGGMPTTTLPDQTVPEPSSIALAAATFSAIVGVSSLRPRKRFGSRKLITSQV